MNEKKRLYVVLGTIVAMMLLIVVTIFGSQKSQEEVYKEFKDKLNGVENALIYIGRPTCQYCTLLSPNLEEMSKRYDFEYLYLNIDELGSSIMNQVLSDLKISSVGTPYLAIVKAGTVVNTQNGYTDYDVTFKFLQDNNIIKEDEKLLLNYIKIDEYKELLAEDEVNVIVVGQSTCPYALQAKLILNEIVYENKIDINYFNVSYIETEEKFKEFENSLEYFKSEWGTPVMIVTKNGQLLDVKEGLATKEGYIEFLKENEVL